MNDYRHTAALALAKCAAYDPWFPKASQSLVESWAEQIQRWKLDLDDVLDGVTRMYSEHGSGFRPLPKDLIDAGRAVRRERDARTGPTSEYQALCDSKAAPDELTAARQARLDRIVLGSFRSLPTEDARIQALVDRQRRSAPPTPMSPETSGAPA